MKYVFIALTVINLAVSGIALYKTSRLATVEATVVTHDRVILEIICATRVSGIIDLDRCVQVVQ